MKRTAFLFLLSILLSPALASAQNDGYEGVISGSPAEHSNTQTGGYEGVTTWSEPAGSAADMDFGTYIENSGLATEDRQLQKKAEERRLKEERLQKAKEGREAARQARLKRAAEAKEAIEQQRQQPQE